MTITDAHLYRYRLPLTDPLSVGERTLTEREGLLLCLQDSDGREGWGEAAPLPGFSEASLGDVLEHGRRLADLLVGMEISVSGRNTLLGSLPEADLHASVQFAGESALVELGAAVRGISVLDLLGGGDESVALNALITDDCSDLVEAAENIRKNGYRAAKLKVGRRDISADVARVRRVHAALNGEVSLRLDANRAWTVEEATTFAEEVGELSLAYVEEPLADPTALPGLVEATGLPVALDETTREGDPGELPDDYPIRAVILKPTLLGGITPTRAWTQWAERREAVPVVSASYESGVGLRMLAALASSLPSAPAGLSTYSRLAADVLLPRPPIEGPNVRLPDLYAARVDRSAVHARSTTS